jgi:hypothetical protein
VVAKIYAEGGGEGQLMDVLFREGWNTFFAAAGLAGRMPKVVRGKGRENTFDMFATAVRNPRDKNEIPLLLVDSEDPLVAGRSVWQHLKIRDNWSRPKDAAEDQAFLMVQVMETWFLADRDLLRRYFGSNLREQHLREWPALEGVPKETVLKALEQATAACKKPYTKGKVSYELLEKLNSEKVEAACPHAKALLDRLRGL